MEGTNLVLLSFFDLIITASIMQSDNRSMRESMNRNDEREQCQSQQCP